MCLCVHAHTHQTRDRDVQNHILGDPQTVTFKSGTIFKSLLKKIGLRNECFSHTHLGSSVVPKLRYLKKYRQFKYLHSSSAKGETYLNFVTFIYILIITYRWWEPHIMERNLPLWLPAESKHMYHYVIHFRRPTAPLTTLPSASAVRGTLFI